jgi:two-component system, NarL family, response regulator DegU
VILYVSMPVMNGFEAARLLRSRTPDQYIVLVSHHTETIYVKEAQHVGVHGYVLKSAVGTDLPDVIRAVLRGQSFWPPNQHMTAR